MKKCGLNCIPACLICKEFDYSYYVVNGGEKGFCMRESEPIEVDIFSKCSNFKCIDSK